MEGLETAKQVAFLDQATADQVQGFFLGRPIPARDVAAGIVADFQQTAVQPLPLLEAKEKLQLAK